MIKGAIALTRYNYSEYKSVSTDNSDYDDGSATQQVGYFVTHSDLEAAIREAVKWGAENVEIYESPAGGENREIFIDEYIASLK